MADANLRWGRVARAAARGLVGAMAMSGARTITSNLELVEETPPRKIVEQQVPGWVRGLSESRRQAYVELVHWAYGAGGGLVFGLLPDRLRTHPASGPVYGMVMLAGFELGIAPVLGVEHQRSRISGRVVLALDHLLYGVLVGGRLAPEPDLARRDAARR